MQFGAADGLTPLDQARAGLMLSATPAGAKEPTRISQGVSDQMGAIMLSYGVMAALVARAEQGVGQKVDVSHLSANMWLQGLGVTMSLLLGGANFGSYDRVNPANPLANAYRCDDGTWIQLQHLQSDRHWEPLAEVVGIAELVQDARFATMQARADNSAELVCILDGRFATRTYDEWDRAFREAGDFIYAKVQAVQDLEHDPQVVANDYITGFEHPALGAVKMCNHPIIYGETPSKIQTEAPELGQHTEEVLIEELGYDWNDLERLREAGAIL